MKKPILRSTLLAAMIAAMAGQAHAAGLGRISVLSGLGQPLRAEVEVAATPEELDTLSARMAPIEAFKRANIEYASSLASVRMSIERRAGGAIVRMSSDRAFNEPFVDLLVELNWAGGRLLREYTFLLDPADVAPARPVTLDPGPIVSPPTASPVRPSEPATRATPLPSTAPSRPAAAAPAAAAPAARAPAKPATAADGDYTVKGGDTLSSIASQLKASDVSQQQMLAALYQANTDAFIGGNINRLRSGRILSVPEAETAKAISPSEAREIVLKASSFDEYRSQVAGAAASGRVRDTSSGQTASGKIAPRVEEPTAPAAGQDKLKIAKTQVGTPAAAGADKAAAARVQALEEDIASRDKALKEANSRLAALEKNVKDLQNLVDLKNKNLADLQKRAADADLAAKEALKKAEAAAKTGTATSAKQAAADAKKAAEDAKKAAAEAKKAEEERKKEEAKRLADEKKAEALRKEQDAKRLADEKKAEEARVKEEAARAEEARKAEAARVAEEARLAEEARVAEAARLAEAQSAAAAATQSDAAVVAESAPVAEAPVVAEAASPAAPQPVPQAPVVVEEEPFFPGGTLGLLLAVAAGGGGLLLWRRRQQRAKASGLNTTALSEASTSPNSVFGNAGGQTVDTGTSVLHTDFSQSGLSAIDTDEGVDPVAEADVYMAYGRDAQAEEILLDALKNDPSRGAIYVKLLEIYSQRKSVKQFENIASDLFTQTGGAGEDWAKAAVLGAKLDPDNPLYRSGGVSAGAPAAAKVDTLATAGVAAAAPMLTLPEEPAAAPVDEAVSFGTNNVSQMRATWTVPGEINQYRQDGDGVMVAEIPPTQPAPEPLNLDFNLDLELPEENEPETRMESRDLDEDDILRPLEEQTIEEAPPESAPLEFDMNIEEFKAPDQRLQQTEPEGISKNMIEPLVMPEQSSSVNSLLSDADLGIERNLGDDEGLAEVDLEKTNFEGNLLDFDFELGDEGKRGTAMPDRSLDLSNMNLRTDGNVTATGGIAPAQGAAPARAAAPAANAGIEDLPESIDLNEEVSTKLELARAYEEMGDFEGARELLEEVVADGVLTQKDEARQILSRLG